VRLLRTIQLDASDSLVFEKAAAPGEWAVSGAFAFARNEPAKLHGKARRAFRAGFLGLASLGRSTLVQIVHASEADRGSVVDMLAAQLVAHFGAPDVYSARLAAEDEIDCAASLCVHPAGVVAAVTRRYEERAIRETLRALHPREGGGQHARAFEFLEIVGEGDTPYESLDLAGLGKGVGP
jgi:Family of unknown function (DUF6505)